jgi:glycosyltransferase involved in cell wall biosynthesis
MRLLFVTTSYPRWPGDHVGAFVAAQARHLEALGHKVRVLAPTDRGERGLASPMRYAPAPAERLFYGAGVPETLAAAPYLSVLIPPALASMTAHTLAHALDWRPDYLVAHWMLPCGLAARLTNKLAPHRPAVRLIGHSGDVHLLRKLPPSVARTLCAGARVAVVSEPLAQHMRALGVESDVVLPMGFEPLEVRPAAHRRDWLWMGRLVPIKAPLDALEAFRRMLALLPAEERPRLHIAGDGPLRAACAAYIVQHDLPATLHGFLDHAALGRVMSGCAASLWSSTILEDGRHEGAPVSLLECCAAGLVPCIAQVPGAEWTMVEPGAQALPARDLDGWASTMAALHARPDRAILGAQTAQRVAHLSWPTLIHNWERFICD